jgi:hypothetical protein
LAALVVAGGFSAYWEAPCPAEHDMALVADFEDCEPSRPLKGVIRVVRKGEMLRVRWRRYGKDYMCLNVITEDGQTGYVGYEGRP